MWWYSNKFRIDEIHTFPYDWKRTFITEEVNGFFSLFWSGVILGGGQSSSNCLSGPRRGEASPYENKWKRNQDAVYRERLKEEQDQGLEFWQPKSLAIMIPGDCIDRVTAQHGDRVLFERLATPTPAPKVTLKRNWQSQQQQQQQSQQPISLTDVLSIWKQRVTWESKAEVQDDSKHIAEAD